MLCTAGDEHIPCTALTLHKLLLLLLLLLRLATVQETAIQYLKALGSEALIKATNITACYTKWTTLVLNDTTAPPAIIGL